MINARVLLDPADPSSAITSTRGPYHITQPCVDVVIETRTGTWGAEMEWRLWDGINTTHPIVYAKNSPESINMNTPDMFPTDSVTEHYRFASGYQGKGDQPGSSSIYYHEGNGLNFDEPLCLTPAKYELEAIDTFGDGWNGLGTIRAKTAVDNVVFAGPVNPEGYSTILDLQVNPIDATDAQVSPCVAFESCGACSAYTGAGGSGCGWCINSGKCSATGGSCSGLYISGDIQCPNNIQVSDLTDTYYEKGDDITIKWSGTGFTSDSSTLVSLYKGHPGDCTEDQLAHYSNFTECPYVDFQFDLATNQQMDAGLGNGITRSLTWPRFTNDDDYFIVVISNVEDGVFGYGNHFEFMDPYSGLCQGVKHLQISHATFLGDGDTSYGDQTEAFITDGSAGDNYENMMACEWVIEAPPGYVVYLSFLDVEVETGCHDLITLRDGNNTDAPLRSYVCAPLSNPTGETVTAPSVKSLTRQMHIQWKTDELITSGGFEAVATAVLAPVSMTSDDSSSDDNIAAVEEITLPPCSFAAPVNGVSSTTHVFDQAASNMGTIGSGYEIDQTTYNLNMHCVWKFTARFGYVMDFVFEQFDLEPHRDICAYDSLLLQDDQDPSIEKLYCGGSLKPTWTSTSNKVTITFRSDSSMALGGFKLKYTAKENVMTSLRRLQLAPPLQLESSLPGEPQRRFLGGAAPEIGEHCDEETIITMSGDNLKGAISDGYASAYGKNTNCKWIINIDEPGYGIKLDFETFHVEGGEEPAPCQYDYVKISDGEGRSMGTICGRKNSADGYIYSTCSETENCSPNKFTGPGHGTFYTQTSQMVVEFVTDDSVQLAGFVANFKAIGEHDIPNEHTPSTRSWEYGEWGDCEPIRFGFNDGERQRNVQCGWDDADGPEFCPEAHLFPATSSDKWEDDDDLNFGHGIRPTTIYSCMVEGSSLRWSGVYEIENAGCRDSEACCFNGRFNVKQKNSDQRNSIHITELEGYGPEAKCQPMAGDSIDYGTGEDIYFPLIGDGDEAGNSGTFIVYGEEFTALKSGGFMEFQGTSDQGISLGHCEEGDCVPKKMDPMVILTMVLVETAIVVILLMAWYVYRSVNTAKAKNKALKAAQKDQEVAGDLNEIVEKRLARERQKAEEAREARMRRGTFERASSMDNMEILADEDFSNFEGVDLCGMQKLSKIDTRDPHDRKIVQAFNKADTDGSGFIDTDELLRAMIETTGKPWTRDQVQAIMDEFDDSGDGELGVEEFKLLVNSTVGGSLNLNRNKYSDEDYNREWTPPSREVAIEYSRSHLPKCPLGMEDELWAKEPLIFRLLFGDGEKKELRPVWSTDIDDCDYGVGISLYFKNLVFLCYMLFGAFLITIPIIISNAMNQSSSLDFQLRGSYVSSESLNIMAGVTDIVVCALLALVLTLADEKEKQIIAKIDAGVQTPADYTLVLKGAPPVSEVSIGEWRKYFEEITKGMERDPEDYVDEDKYIVEDMNKAQGTNLEDGKVVSITYCVKGARTMYDLVRKRRALEDKLYLKVRALKKKDPDYKLPHATNKDPPTFMQKLLCGGSIPPEFLLTELDDLDTRIDNFQMSDKPKMGSRMFVTFDTELALDTACVKSYEVKGPTGKCPKVKQSCEASDLIYKNMSVGIWNRRMREIVGYLICFSLIFGSLAFLVWVNEQRYDPRVAGYAVAVVNSFLKVFCEYWCKNIELPLTYSDQQYSLMTKLTAARVFNTAILLLFTCERSEVGTGFLGLPKFLYLNTEFVAKVQSTIFADITLSIGKIVDAPLLFNRLVLAKFMVPPTQTQYNKLYDPRKWNLAERYSDNIKTLFTCLLYISIFPTGLAFAGFSFGLAFFCDKFCILRTWERPPEFDYKMSVTARYILEWTLVAHLAMTVYLYSQWPFSEIQTEMSKVYTPQQAILVLVYTTATLGAAAFFGAKQFGNILVAMVTDSIGAQRCERSCIVRWCSCLRPPEQKLHVARYSSLPGYGLASYNPHPEGETASDFEAFHVLNNMDKEKKEKILAPKIVAFMPKSDPGEYMTVNKVEDEELDPKFKVIESPKAKYAAMSKKEEEDGDVEMADVKKKKGDDEVEKEEGTTPQVLVVKTDEDGNKVATL